MPAETFDAHAESAAGQADAVVALDQTFPVGEQCTLVVENPRGRIRIVGEDRADVHVRATKRRYGSSEARFNATRVEARHDGDTIALRTVLDGASAFGDWFLGNDFLAEAVRSLTDMVRNATLPAEVVYEVEVPRHCDVDVKGVSCEITLDDVRGAVRAKGVSGPVSLMRVRGDLDIATVSGPISGQDLDGYADAKSVSGTIRLRGQLDALKAHTVSGSMELTGPTSPDGSYDFHSVSGSVTVRVPADTRASVDVRGVSAEVRSDLACEVTRDRRAPGSREWRGLINGGGAMIQFRTVSGHLYLARLAGVDTVATVPASAETPEPSGEATNREAATGRDDGATSGAASAEDRGDAASPAAAANESGESARLQILRALEQGEIAVDEALRQIDALRGKD